MVLPYVKKWEEFKEKYGLELKEKEELLHRIGQAEKENETVTLLYSAKDEKHNNAVVLSTILKATL
jgi:uncharacterized protein YeaO (DUF488 family)